MVENSNNNNGKKYSTFEVRLDNDKATNQKENNTVKVVRSSTCCLTCGGTKRIQWLEKVDGTKVLKEACLYCLTKVHTKANEEDH